MRNERALREVTDSFDLMDARLFRAVKGKSRGEIGPCCYEQSKILRSSSHELPHFCTRDQLQGGEIEVV
jgi:hypothetical protein